MSERDLLIERLERKLAEKERELSELRRMMSGRDDIEKLKAEIISQIKSELPIAELESKIIELRRAIESIITEIAYIKGELKNLTERGAEDAKKEDRAERQQDEDVAYITPEPEKVEENDDDILICD